MGLSTPTALARPPLLPDRSGGQPVPVPARPARVVVLTFFNAACNDICPVVAAEMQQSGRRPGCAGGRRRVRHGQHRPSALAQSAEAPVLSTTRLGTLTNWHMVTGPLATLNSIWKAYGVSISVDKKTRLEAHNDVMVFIDPAGYLRYRATPFADESTTGSFSLPSDEHRPLGPGDRHLRREVDRPGVSDPIRRQAARAGQGADLAAPPRSDHRPRGPRHAS